MINRGEFLILNFINNNNDGGTYQIRIRKSSINGWWEFQSQIGVKSVTILKIKISDDVNNHEVMESIEDFDHAMFGD